MKSSTKILYMNLCLATLAICLGCALMIIAAVYLSDNGTLADNLIVGVASGFLWGLGVRDVLVAFDDYKEIRHLENKIEYLDAEIQKSVARIDEIIKARVPKK